MVWGKGDKDEEDEAGGVMLEVACSGEELWTTARVASPPLWSGTQCLPFEYMGLLYMIW